MQKITRKLPKSAVVSIKGNTSQGFSYAEVLRKARSHIKIEDLEIIGPRIRKGMNGATLIEIKGSECNEKAQLLANRLQEVLREDNVAITTPTIKGDLKLSGLDESIEKEDIRWAIKEYGECDPEDIRIGEIRKTVRGIGIVWLQCPLRAAIKIVNQGKIKVGWSIVSVTLMKARPLQCYKCWQHGHVKDQCRVQKDRSRCCFNCGKEGHRAVTCNSDPTCIVCKDLGKDYSHRVGSAKCTGVKSLEIRSKANDNYDNKDEVNLASRETPSNK